MNAVLRSYVIGLPVIVSIYDDGQVAWEVDTSETSVAIAKDENAADESVTDDQRRADANTVDRYVPGTETREVWSCSVISPAFPAPTTTLHASEDDAIEALRLNYDPEGEYEGRSIVEELENTGYHINIDVHQI